MVVVIVVVVVVVMVVVVVVGRWSGEVVKRCEGGDVGRVV